METGQYTLGRFYSREREREIIERIPTRQPLTTLQRFIWNACLLPLSLLFRIVIVWNYMPCTNKPFREMLPVRWQHKRPENVPSIQPGGPNRELPKPKRCVCTLPKVNDKFVCTVSHHKHPKIHPPWKTMFQVVVVIRNNNNNNLVDWQLFHSCVRQHPNHAMPIFDDWPIHVPNRLGGVVKKHSVPHPEVSLPCRKPLSSRWRHCWNLFRSMSKPVPSFPFLLPWCNPFCGHFIIVCWLCGWVLFWSIRHGRPDWICYKPCCGVVDEPDCHYRVFGRIKSCLVRPVSIP